jgi:hypothetical protein
MLRVLGIEPLVPKLDEYAIQERLHPTCRRPKAVLETSDRTRKLAVKLV